MCGSTRGWNLGACLSTLNHTFEAYLNFLQLRGLGFVEPWWAGAQLPSRPKHCFFFFQRVMCRLDSGRMIKGLSLNHTADNGAKVKEAWAHFSFLVPLGRPRLGRTRAGEGPIVLQTRTCMCIFETNPCQLGSGLEIKGLPLNHTGTKGARPTAAGARSVFLKPLGLGWSGPWRVGGAIAIQTKTWILLL